ncbi:MAG: hydantoinase B/oxoprolinase family protein [Pseudomonadota bacterium]
MSVGRDQKIDPLKLTLFWNRLIAIVEEQAQTLIRTAFSSTVREAGDLSAGVFTTSGEMVAQAVTGTPGHVNAMAASVRAFLSTYPIRTLCDGDVLVTNDPWLGTGHLNDFTVVTPIFRRGEPREPIALFAATSHIADVGGLGFGPDGRDVFEEGLQVPISKLFSAGEANQTLISLLRANVRDPGAAEGDLQSLATCNAVGGAQLLAAMDDLGFSSLDYPAAEIIANAETAMRAAIDEAPAGVFENSMRIDGYNEPIDLRCTVTIGNGAITLDFAGSSAVSSRGVNVPLTYTQAYASFGVRCLIGGDIPNNAGSLAPVRVLAPAGSILNAERPAPVSARHVVGQMLPDVVLGALAKALPEKAPAEGASCLYLPVLRSLPEDPTAFVLNPFYTGGAGARPTKDGLSCTAFPSGVKNTPVEINEINAPIIMRRKEFRPGSGGKGRFIGGHGQTLEFAHAEGRDMVASNMFDRIVYPARGREGGGSGAPGGVSLSSGERLPGMGRTVIPGGESLIIKTPGGGGFGDPDTRSNVAIAEDKRKSLRKSDS